MHQNITDTGIRGYLQWLKADQPQLYRVAAPIIAQQVPGAFSDREQSMGMGFLMRGLGDDATGVDFLTTDLSSSSLLTPTGASGGFVSDSQSGTDVASAANSGASSPGIVSSIGNIVSALAQGYLAASQVQTLSQANQIQLQRAQAGLPPLNLSSLQLGVPTVNLGLSQSTLAGGGVALAVVAGLGLLFLMGGKKRRAAHA